MILALPPNKAWKGLCLISELLYKSQVSFFAAAYMSTALLLPHPKTLSCLERQCKPVS